MVSVEISPEALEDLDRLPESMIMRIRAVLSRLENWPEISGAKALRHDLKGHFRVRTGDWRVLFHLEGSLLVVDRVDNRKDVYER
ncbi:MAG: type II toxin-antitoxin system RelE/ParE family toxin [Tepidisphaerales bacterium]